MQWRWRFAVLVVIAAVSVGGYALASSGSGANPVRTSHPLVPLSVIRARLRAAAQRAAERAVRLDGDGLGVTKFGATASSATKAISAVLGKPTGHPAAACTPAYRQTAWLDLVVQFVAGRFRGYRYLDRGPNPEVAPTAAVVRAARPKLSTATGISLGSTLADAERAYPTLRRSATESYQTRSGITFSFWSPDNPNRNSRIYEIKNNACPAAI
jgi:hypothetical protein